MEFWWWILLGAVVMIGGTVFLSRRAVRSGPDPTQLTIEPAVIAEIEQLCAQGRSVEAIAVLRRATGLNLLNAKVIVDRVDRRRQERSGRQRPPGAAAPSAAAPSTPASSLPVPPAVVGDSDVVDQPSASEVDLDTELHVRSLIAEGRRRDAVNLVRARTDWDAEQAGRFIDSL